MSEPSLLEVLHANLLSETAVRMSCQGQRLQVHEIASSTGNYFEDEENHGPEAEAIALACWNCGACSHRYQECLGEKKVFCYGCGKPETYKPSCNRCNGKKKLESPCTIERCTQTDSHSRQDSRGENLLKSHVYSNLSWPNISIHQRLQEQLKKF